MAISLPINIFFTKLGYATWLHYCTCITIEKDNFESGVHGGLKFHSTKAAAQLNDAYK
jgi:hypothetical protein